MTRRPFVALYKCHRGGEWFESSLNGIKSAVDEVVAVFGAPWVQTDMPENCSEPLDHFSETNSALPVTRIHIPHNNQDEQYTVGVEYIKQKYGSDVGVMIVDTDEIWLNNDAQRLRTLVESRRNVGIFRVAMKTFVRSPLYEVAPTEPNRPTVAINVNCGYNVSLRFSKQQSGPSNLLEDVYMYHYSFVRREFEDIVLKFYATESQEDVRSREDWLTTVWERIPNVINCHPAKGFEYCWQRFRILRESEMPACISALPFVHDIIAREKEVQNAALSPKC